MALYMGPHAHRFATFSHTNKEPKYTALSIALWLKHLHLVHFVIL